MDRNPIFYRPGAFRDRIWPSTSRISPGRVGAVLDGSIGRLSTAAGDGSSLTAGLASQVPRATPLARTLSLGALGTCAALVLWSVISPPDWSHVVRMGFMMEGVTVDEVSEYRLAAGRHPTAAAAAASAVSGSGVPGGSAS